MSFSSDPPLQANQLSISIDFPPTDKDEFLEVLTLDRKRIVNAVNTKEGALYLIEEIASFQQYFGIDPVNIQVTRSGYRTTFDLVALNGGPIGPGTTPITLTTTSQPPLIDDILYPVHGFGGATTAGPIYYFINDPDVYVRFDNTNPLVQVINITNNTGLPLTQAYWTFEYLKN